jgi:hypothetical protein
MLRLRPGARRTTRIGGQQRRDHRWRGGRRPPPGRFGYLAAAIRVVPKLAIVRNDRRDTTSNSGRTRGK